MWCGVQGLIGRVQHRESPALIASPRDVIVSPRGIGSPRPRSPGLSTRNDLPPPAPATARGSPPRMSLVSRVRSIMPRLSLSSDAKSTPRGASPHALSGPLALPLHRCPSPATSFADTVSFAGESTAGGSSADGQHSSPISAQGTPRWRVAAAQVRSRGQGALAAGREKVALGREKGRMLLASVGGAGGAMSALKRVKAAVSRGGGAGVTEDCERGSRRRFLARWGRSQQV